jgi:hypothetical protein
LEDISEKEKKKPSNDQLSLFFRYGIEEIMRRNLQGENYTITPLEIVEILMPDYKAFLRPIVERANRKAMGVVDEEPKD